MNTRSIRLREGISRRSFLQTSGHVVAGAAFASALARPGYAAESNTIDVALIGCGGRGGGAAAQALSTQGPTRLRAVADVFPDRVRNIVAQLKQQFPRQGDVDGERRFVGFDAYQKAIDSVAPGGAVILATPPAFRPLHLEYAVARGCHVFMEKSFAVDGPGIRRVLAAGQAAGEKGLKIAGGLMSRHYPPLEQAIDQIHQGSIGEVITAWAYRMHGPVALTPREPGMKELEHQIANYSCFTWLNGSFIVDWLIHNIDVCCWVKDAWPVSVQGMGSRQTRTEPDQLFDQYFAEYTFPDGTRMAAQGRHINNTYAFFGDIIHGAKGSAVLGEGIPSPRIFKGHHATPGQLIWQYRGEPKDAYQIEHDLWFDAIRNNKPHNETDRCAKACLTAIMGRMACDSGKTITWDEALSSKCELAPGLANLKSFEDPAPVMPDAEGRYPIAKPGTTEVL